MNENETDGQLLLAVFNAKDSDDTVCLFSDGFWHGDEPLASAANRVACFYHCTPADGDPAVFACETLCDLVAGSITPFFATKNLKKLESPDTIAF